MAQDGGASTPLLEQFRLDGRTAIVTGVGEGIGEAVARGYAEVGANVVLCARSAARVEAIAGSIEAAGGSAHPVGADVSGPEGIARLIDEAHARFGPVSVLFNNAAGGHDTYARRGPEGEKLDGGRSEDDLWDEGLAVNVKAPARLVRALVDDLRADGHGSVINVLSSAGLVPVPRSDLWPYGTTKAGLLMLTRYMAKELAPEIRVNAISPGTIDTRAEMREWFSTLTKGTPLARVGHPREVVGAALFLASDAASYVTGQVICVDGGRVNLASM